MRFTCVTWAEWFQWKPMSDSTYWEIASAACLSFISKQLGPFLCWSFLFCYLHARLVAQLPRRWTHQVWGHFSSARPELWPVCLMWNCFALVCVLFFCGVFAKKEGNIFVFHSSSAALFPWMCFTWENVNLCMKRGLISLSMFQTCLQICLFFCSEPTRLMCCKSCSPILRLVLEPSMCISHFVIKCKCFAPPTTTTSVVDLCFAFLLDLSRGIVCVCCYKIM